MYSLFNFLPLWLGPATYCILAQRTVIRHSPTPVCWRLPRFLFPGQDETACSDSGPPLLPLIRQSSSSVTFETLGYQVHLKTWKYNCKINLPKFFTEHGLQG